MYLPRHVDGVLDEWYRDPARKPQVLRGARQTGKSTSVRELGKRTTAFFEVNLDRAEDRRLARAAGKLKSLHRFLWATGRKVALRVHAGNLVDERQVVRMPAGELHHRLVSLPMYLAGELHKRVWE